MLAVSESRWTGQGVTKIGSYTILHSGSSSAQVHGVAIILSPKAASSWETAGSVFLPVSERIIRIRMKTHLGFATIVAVYAPVNPTNATSDARAPSDAFYDALHSTLSSAPSRDMTIILGDFNARVGSRSSQWSSVVGPYGPNELNENGEQLLDFCAGHDLIVSNTWFQHKPIHQLTWYRNGDRSKAGHLIDLVLVHRKFRSSVLDTRVFRCTHHQSDHELVISTIRFKIKSKRLLCRTNPRIQTQGLPKNMVTSFQSALSDAHSTIHQTAPAVPGVNSIWTSFKETISAACDKLPRARQRQEVDWMTDEVRNLSSKKKDAWIRLCNDRNPHNITSYKRLCKLTKLAADKARNSWWSACAEEAEKRAAITESLGRGGSLIRELRLLGRGAAKASSSTLQAVDGTVLTSDENKLCRWAEHFASVTQCSSQVSEVVLETLPSVQAPSQNSSPDDEELCSPITEEEISTAISQMKNGKAPGLDGISSEVLKLGGEASVRWLSSIFATIWTEESVPSDWTKQLVVPIHKKGSQSDCDNFRGISLLSVPSKVFTKVISNRLKPRVEHLLRESQCGFRKGRGCNDQIYTLRVLMEKAREFHQPLYMCFIDLRKAYDSVNRDALWTVLQRCYHLPEKILSIIRAMHDESTAAVRAYGKTSDEFAVTSGVRQGCVLAPTLFNLFFDAVIHMAIDDHLEEGRGVRIVFNPDAKLVGDRRKMTLETLVTDLEYADDMVPLSNSWSDLEVMIKSLHQQCTAMGLTISCRKTKTLAVLPSSSCPQPQPILLSPAADPVEPVTAFQYLGSTVSQDCSNSAEVSSRIVKVQPSYMD